MNINTFLLLYIIVVSISCSNPKRVDELYKLYEVELIKGDTNNAEAILDEIIKIDKSIKYIKLKIPFLVSACKKEEAIRSIDKILEKENTNYDLLFLKILLYNDKNVQKTKNILEMKKLLFSNIEKKCIIGKKK